MLQLVEWGENFIFFALLVASIIAVAVVTERIIVFRRNTSKVTERMLLDIIENLRSHNLQGARDCADKSKPNAFTRLIGLGTRYHKEGHSGVNDLMNSKISQERLDLEKRLSILNTLGNNAPFIGLLGTVLGVIMAFHNMGTLGNTGGEVVMRSISKALLATAAGLFVAIPVVMANNYFTRKLKIIIQKLEILASEFSASIKKQKHGGDHGWNAEQQ